MNPIKNEERLPMDYPKLRNIEIFPVQSQGRSMLCLRDPLNFAAEAVFIPYELLEIIRYFDGKHSILDIQVAYTRRHGGLLFSNNIRKLVSELDEKLFMDSERFQQQRAEVEASFKNALIRKATHAGTTYHANPEALRNQLNAFFAAPQGPGKPNFAMRDVTPQNPKTNKGSALKAVIAPHIDLRRGGACFAHTYKHVAEESDADLFVILGVNHFGGNGFFSLTRKDFATPLGLLETDTAFIDALAQNYGDDLFAGEFVHKQEHSIEFQVVFLHYLFGNQRPIKIAPILCSSFHEIIAQGVSPSEVKQVKTFIESLKKAIAESNQKICLIAGVDLSHVGGRFGDEGMLTTMLLNQIKSEDLQMLQTVEALEAEEFYHSIQQHNDRRRICGLPAIYTMLSVLDASEGKLSKYDQSVERETQSVVSYASMYFSG
ncbi:AmmeMemoRadiSam system protein B [Candidatus Poribacteria bacterium]|nr:AmmeMemoRadiSam system protein B [Candidatus Poribacteria bacterium]